MAEVPPPKRDAAAASEDEQNTKQQKTEGTGLKRADGSPWEPITGTLVPIVGGKEGLKQEWRGAAASASCQGRFATARPRAGR